MKTAIVLFTRDLRVRDNPALAAAAREAEHVLPLFVLDEAMLARFGAPNRVAFLGESLDDLATSLGGLAIRRGDTVEETVRLARVLDASSVFLAEDASWFAQRRERRLAGELDVRTFPSTSVVGIGELSTSTGGHYKVFTPYWNAWRQAPRRAVLRTPKLKLPPGVELGRLPELGSGVSPERAAGGESAGRQRLKRFLARDAASYGNESNDLAADTTSRLSPYLHFGCVSPLEVAERAASSAPDFVRQICWRDFFLQLLAANPSSSQDDLRPGRRRWRESEGELEAWKAGLTGYPIVDAGMRQLRQEGWMHNRARLIVGSFLTKTLRLDWRLGAKHFFDLLVDGDVASNVGNWQWVAGTGADSRPNRILNPLRQAERFDPTGAYVRRYVPELAAVEGKAVHTPWKLDRPVGYPERIVDHEEAARRFRAEG